MLLSCKWTLYIASGCWPSCADDVIYLSLCVIRGGSGFETTVGVAISKKFVAINVTIKI